MKSVLLRLGILRRFSGRLRLPRRTVRLRLTLLYGSLFLASGFGLLILTNVLVRQTTGQFVALGDDSALGADITLQAGDVRLQLDELTNRSDSAVARLLGVQAEEFRASAEAQRAADRRQLLIQSGVALCIMSVVSIGLGWIVAGRVLRPLRTITTAAQDISATNLHRRLALHGPDDELKELGDTFDELLGRLERTFEAQRQFVANASHELRTPLARQRTLIEVALTDPDATVDSLRASHQRVLASGEQQERLIEALLTLARSERGLDQEEPLDLAALVADVLAAVRHELERRKIHVESDLGRAWIMGDLALVERLATNLIDNAIRHNTKRGAIDVRTGTRDEHTFLIVSNTGLRVPAEDVERLFQPFRRLGRDRVRQTDGHGLGLSIVQAIASTHGATLRASPRPAGGLDVEVRFPSSARRAASADSMSLREPRRPSGRRGPSQASSASTGHTPVA